MLEYIEREIDLNFSELTHSKMRRDIVFSLTATAKAIINP